MVVVPPQDPCRTLAPLVGKIICDGGSRGLTGNSDSKERMRTVDCPNLPILDVALVSTFQQSLISSSGHDNWLFVLEKEHTITF